MVSKSEVPKATSLLIVHFLLRKKKKKGVRGQLARGRKGMGRNLYGFQGSKEGTLRSRGLGLRDLSVPFRSLCS